MYRTNILWDSVKKKLAHAQWVLLKYELNFLSLCVKLKAGHFLYKNDGIQ